MKTSSSNRHQEFARLMMQDIRETQQELEGATYYAVANFEKEPGKKSSDDLTAFCEDNAKNTVSEWWNLLEKLIVKYNDGCITTENEIMKNLLTRPEPCSRIRDGSKPIPSKIKRINFSRL